jgi:hypothetical protein
MNDQRIQGYIQSAIAQGFSLDQIRQNLLSAGWQRSVIEPYLINQTSPVSQSPVSQIVQPTPTVDQTLANTTIDSSTPLTTESSQLKTPMMVKAALGMLGLGVIFVAIFIILSNLGKKVYLSPKTDFSQNNIQKEQDLDLTTQDNPYRIFLHVSYTVKGDPLGTGKKLFDYNFSVVDDLGDQMVTTNGTYEYHKRSSSDETSLSTQNINITLPIETFQVEKNGSYKIVTELAVPKSLDSNFSLSDWNYELKGKVLSPPSFLIISGIILIALALILFFINKKKQSQV